jgi:hypothetical protein
VVTATKPNICSMRILMTDTLLKAFFAEVAAHRKAEWIAAMLSRLLEPYAPVRMQLHCILREINRRRGLAGYDSVPAPCIRVRRRVVRPFEKANQPLVEKAAQPRRVAAFFGTTEKR